MGSRGSPNWRARYDEGGREEEGEEGNPVAAAARQWVSGAAAASAAQGPGGRGQPRPADPEAVDHGKGARPEDIAGTTKSAR